MQHWVIRNQAPDGRKLETCVHIPHSKCKEAATAAAANEIVSVMLAYVKLSSMTV